MSSNKIYYRPYLTAENVAELDRLLSEQLPASFISNLALLDAYKKIHEIKDKIDKNQAFIAHTTKGSLKEQFVQSLDLDGQSALKPKPIDPVIKRANAWNKFQSNPASCSREELELVKTYRWENGLMGEKEIENYEAELFNPANSAN